MIAPEGGIQEDSRGAQDIVYGLVVNHYEPFDSGAGGSLQDATDDLVREIQRTSGLLRPQGRPVAQRSPDGARELSLVLQGVDPASGLDERVNVVTRELPDGHVLYVLLVAPRDDAATLRPAFERMLESLRVNDRMAHR